jgi:hypothetical protein
MAYLGKPLQFANYPSKFFNGDGTAQTVSLDYAPPNTASVLVFISGVRQDTSAYTLSGTSLTFTGTVPSGTNNVEIVQLGLQTPVGTAGAIQASGTADSTTFLRGDYTWNAVTVGAITTEGDFYYNYNTISADVTTTVASTKAAFVAGPITIADTFTWTISGELTMI